ncbi:PepSY domain-containing protein [Anaerobacillus sp. MEB173]|uniref:PepSY domain-containing protein n=1 Tax=Anaerobacillus sp. MEB173 TaxID=3383345 RepID=UPI003F8FD6E1
MGLKRIAFGIGIGFIAGLVVRSSITKETVSPEKALRIVKEKLKTRVTIDGSWIHMIPETLTKDQLEYTVYRGGISSTQGQEDVQFDFVVDAATGTILELTSQSN